MPNTYLDKAIAAVPKFGERISLFTKKLRLAQYADSSIYDYRLKISQAALYLNKLPDDFTQADIDSCAAVIYLLSTFVLSVQNRQRWLLPMDFCFPQLLRHKFPALLLLRLQS
jgi:hypothetical protein